MGGIALNEPLLGGLLFAFLIQAFFKVIGAIAEFGESIIKSL